MIDDFIDPNSDIWISSISEDASTYLMNSCPEFANSCRIQKSEIYSISTSTFELLEPVVIAVDTNFLTFFELQLQNSSDESPLDKNEIILSSGMASRMFHAKNPVGQIVEVNEKGSSMSYVVSGVVDISSYNSGLKFDAVVPIPKSISQSVFYVKQSKTVLAESLKKRGNELTALTDYECRLHLETLEEVHFDADNSWSFNHYTSPNIYFIGWSIVILVLIVIVFNFTNLFLLSSYRRRKELGVKQVFGVPTTTLRRSVMIDVAVFMTIGTFISIFISYLMLAKTNEWLEIGLSPNDLFHFEVIVSWSGVFLFLVLIIGILAFERLKSSSPLKLLHKGKSINIHMTRLLLVPQFMISIALVICSLIIVDQINYVKDRPMGMEKDLLVLEVGNRDVRSRLNLLKTEILSQRIVENASLTYGAPIGGGVWYYYVDGLDSEIIRITGDQDYLSTVGISLPDQTIRSGYYINATLAQKLGWQSVNDGRIPRLDKPALGIVADFVNASAYNSIKPAIIEIGDKDNYHRMILNYSGRNLNEVLEQVEKVWEKIFLNESMIYYSTYDKFLKYHNDDLKLLKIVNAFSKATIIIVLFGLIALSWGVIQARTKEVGIRKVIGASSGQIIFLLSKEFMRWVLVAFILAIPVAFWVSQSWLENFAYRIDMPYNTFVVVGLVAGFLSFAIVGTHAFWASQINPTKCLRDE
ncbi:ABC transporter permease [Marinoscillum sp.]|uniref:ABC transporter permease n=1 Tax=Marinoscillum sp. TaxID=2024838 RepID=UPI003BABF292